MSYHFSKTLDVSFDQAVARVTEAFNSCCQTPDRHRNPEYADTEPDGQGQGIGLVFAVDCHRSSRNIRPGEYKRGHVMAIPWIPIPEGTRVKVKRGIFPLDPALVGRTGGSCRPVERAGRPFLGCGHRDRGDRGGRGHLRVQGGLDAPLRRGNQGLGRQQSR